MQILNLWDTMEKWAADFKEWIFDNANNPLLWIGIVVIGFVLFKAVYGALNRD